MELPPWLEIGARVVHHAFGNGTVVDLAAVEGLPTASVDFDAGDRKALMLEYALPVMRPATRADRPTTPDAAQQCDICGARPVALVVSDLRACEPRDRPALSSQQGPGGISGGQEGQGGSGQAADHWKTRLPRTQAR